MKDLFIRNLRFSDTFFTKQLDSLSVLHDHKAFKFSRIKPHLAIPIFLDFLDEDKFPNGAPQYTSREHIWQCDYDFTITPSRGIKFGDRITNLENASNLVESSFYSDSPYADKRIFYINCVFKKISDPTTKINSLDDLKEIHKLRLPEPPHFLRRCG